MTESSLLVEPLLQVREALDSVRDLTKLSRGKFSDKEFAELFSQTIAKEIGTSDLLLSSLLNYLKIAAPVAKANTVHTLIERLLTKYQAQLARKNITATKSFEENLPETIVPEEQLEYILNSILVFVVASTPPYGTVEFSTHCFSLQRGAGGRHIEIRVVFSGGTKRAELSGKSGGGIRPSRKPEAFDLLLRLTKEMVERNRGMMKFQTDEQKGKIILSLIFPVERRKV